MIGRNAVSVFNLAMVAAMMLAACQTVPITGRSQLQVLPESEEIRMGAQSYQDILMHPSEATRIRQIAASCMNRS